MNLNNVGASKLVGTLKSPPRNATQTTAPAADRFSPGAEGLGPATFVRPALVPTPTHAPGFDPANLDRSVNPTSDFFNYANGGWRVNNPIPSDLPRWGTFGMLAENNSLQLKSILTDLQSRTPQAGSNEQKLKDFYASGMDEAGIEAAGIEPLSAEFSRIDNVANLADLQKEVAHLHGIGVGAFFGFGSTQDFRDSTRVIGEADQGGLGLPNRDYYFDESERGQKIRSAYSDHVARMFQLMGDDEAAAAAHAQTVIAIESSLALGSKNNVQLRDPESNYHVTDAAGLDALTPNFNWKQYFKDLGAPPQDSINVGQPEFFKAMDGQLQTRSLDDLKTYMRWNVINSTEKYLPSRFENEDFRFKGTELSGTEKNRDRWKRVVATTDGSLGEALGQLYVEKNFTPEAKARAKEMVGNLKDALRDKLSNLSWMSDDTRKKAVEKMSAFTDKIGYPDKWKDYSSLDIKAGPYVSNVLAAREFAVRQDLDKIGKPVDRTAWGMTPPTVNAYYNPAQNEIVFPAGILQPPFFDPQADDAINYGGIGAVIGHEMTHGFDDQGAQFDGQGNLRNWWTDGDLKQFQSRTTAVATQASQFEVQPGLHINGPFVTGEATADLGGISVAYAAFKKAQAGKPAQVIDGFTPDQRFFLGFAQVWGSNERPEYQRLMIKNDPHPPPQFRVNGTLSNVQEFAEAFHGKPGDPLVKPREQQIHLWE